MEVGGAFNGSGPFGFWGLIIPANVNIWLEVSVTIAGAITIDDMKIQNGGVVTANADITLNDQLENYTGNVRSSTQAYTT